MSETQPTEFIEEPTDGLTERDLADLAALSGEAAPEMEYHTLLEVWTEILKRGNLDANRKVTMKWATGIVGQYPGVTFGDLGRYTDIYFAKVQEMADILAYEISTDEDCFKPSKPGEDAELNATHYKNLIFAWQQAFLVSELEWDFEDPDAALYIAALSEAHKIFFGPNGLLGHLEAIQFVFDEDDSAALAELLTETNDSYAGVEK
jgi:hypothetical protein